MACSPLVSELGPFETKVPSSETRGEQAIDYTFDSILEDTRNYNDWVNNPGQTTALGTETINNNLFEKFVVADMYYSLNYIYKANDKIIRFMVWPHNAQDPEKLPASLKESVYQILSTFKFLDSNSNQNYTCPENGLVDCMPILDEAKQKACSPEAMTWYEANCPNFKGGAR